MPYIVRLPARHALLAACLLIPLAAGCGDGAAPGPSLSSQQQAAMKEADPATRARKLVAVAAKQFQAADQGGGEASLVAAIQAAGEVQEADIRARTLISVAEAYGRAENPTDARKHLRAARGSADEVEDLASRVPLLARCAEVLAAGAGDTDGGRDILKESEKLAGQIDDPAAKVSAQLRIVAALAVVKATGDVKRLAAVAVEGARGLEDPRKRADGLSEAGETLYLAGMTDQPPDLFDESRQSADQIADPHSRGYALLNLGLHQQKAKAGEAAAKSLQAAESAAAKIGDRSLRQGLEDKIHKAQSRPKS